MTGEEKIELLRSALTLAANQLRFTAESVTHDGSSSALYRRRNAIMADANAAFAVLETISQPQEWTCAARKQGTSGGNDPADRYYPNCGCEPKPQERGK